MAKAVSIPRSNLVFHVMMDPRFWVGLCGQRADPLSAKVYAAKGNFQADFSVSTGNSIILPRCSSGIHLAFLRKLLGM